MRENTDISWRFLVNRCQDTIPDFTFFFTGERFSKIFSGKIRKTYIEAILITNRYLRYLIS
jgi:hypothetical protein